MEIDYEEIRTFAYLHSAAAWALDQAEAKHDCAMFPSMHAILASVHCLEAFANHLGPTYFEAKWDTKEAALATPREKLRALLAELRIDLTEVRSAYDTYVLALSIRKQLTHGRTHEVSRAKETQFVEGSTVSSSLPNWHRHCEPKTARRVFEAVTLLVERMGEASGEGRLCWGILGHGFGWQPTDQPQQTGGGDGIPPPHR